MQKNLIRFVSIPASDRHQPSPHHHIHQTQKARIKPTNSSQTTTTTTTTTYVLETSASFMSPIKPPPRTKRRGCALEDGQLQQRQSLCSAGEKTILHALSASTSQSSVASILMLPMSDGRGGEGGDRGSGGVVRRSANDGGHQHSSNIREMKNSKIHRTKSKSQKVRDTRRRGSRQKKRGRNKHLAACICS